MSSSTKAVITDVNGRIIPQYYNPSTDAYEAAQGSNGGLNVQEGPMSDSWAGSATTTRTVPTSRGIAIVNDGAGDLTVTIGSLVNTVKSKEAFKAFFNPFTSVTITTTVAYRAYTIA